MSSASFAPVAARQVTQASSDGSGALHRHFEVTRHEQSGAVQTRAAVDLYGPTGGNAGRLKS